MTIGRTWCTTLFGLDGRLVDVEAHLAPGLPAFTLVGMPDAALGEARDRVRAAVTSCGLSWPNRRTTVNLSPASVPKSGSGFDLAIAVAVLRAAGVLDERSENSVHLGELGLDGRVHPVRGVLPAVRAAVERGQARIVVAPGNAAEAALVADAQVEPVAHLADLVRRYGGEAEQGASSGRPDAVPVVAPTAAGAACSPRPDRSGDLAEVRGQQDARFALEVAAAGGHHLLLIGPPGAGKTMLGARLPGILPDLTESESVEVTSVHSVSGTFDPGKGLLRRPPLEEPHHTATAVAVIGGGSGLARPGAASRAHRGVLLLDEVPEFSARVLETLRQPLESGELVLHRAHGAVRYPARFQLVLTANPCPCGRGGGKGVHCSCTPIQRRRYLTRLSGPLLDRIDLRVEVPAVGRGAIGLPQGESSAAVAKRVADARRRSSRRLAGTPWRTWGEAPGSWLREHAPLDPAGMRDLLAAMDRGLLSMRGLDRVWRVAWTIADLDERERPDRDDVAQAMTLRNSAASQVRHG